jgi:hypothetical protein
MTADFVVGALVILTLLLADVWLIVRIMKRKP